MRRKGYSRATVHTISTLKLAVFYGMQDINDCVIMVYFLDPLRLSANAKYIFSTMYDSSLNLVVSRAKGEIPGRLYTAAVVVTLSEKRLAIIGEPCRDIDGALESLFEVTAKRVGSELELEFVGDQTTLEKLLNAN